MLHQAAKPSEVVGQKIAGKSSGLSATTGVANVEIMKMADNCNIYFLTIPKVYGARLDLVNFGSRF